MTFRYALSQCRVGQPKAAGSHWHAIRVQNSGSMQAREEDPSPIAYQALIACYAHLGRLAEARDALSRLRSISSEIAPPASRLVTLVPEFCKLVQSGLQLAIAES
jgi:pentatricopeptide repeat protein